MDLLTTYCPTVVDFDIPLFRLRENCDILEEDGGYLFPDDRDEERTRGAFTAGLAEALDAARGVYLGLDPFFTRIVPWFGATPCTLLFTLRYRGRAALEAVDAR